MGELEVDFQMFDMLPAPVETDNDNNEDKVPTHPLHDDNNKDEVHTPPCTKLPTMMPLFHNKII